MTEEELKQLEADLGKKADELNKQSEDLTAFSNELKVKESELQKREEDLNNLVATAKKQYEENLEKQRKEFEAKLAEREGMIKQLLNGEDPDNKKRSDGVEALNARRRAQRSFF